MEQICDFSTKAWRKDKSNAYVSSNIAQANNSIKKNQQEKNEEHFPDNGLEI